MISLNMIDLGDKFNGEIIKEVSPLVVGGSEGKKQRIATERETERERGGLSEQQFYIAKEYRKSSVSFAWDSVSAFELLKEKGYPVPRKVVCLEDDAKAYVVMSDVTDGGKCLIWGWSTEMIPEQMDELNKMNITQDDIIRLDILARDIAGKAAGDDLCIRHHMYHVRRHVESGEVDIVLLDADARVYNGDHKSRYTSTDIDFSEAEFFLKNLEEATGVFRPKQLRALSSWKR